MIFEPRDITTAFSMLVAYVVIRVLIGTARMNESLSKPDRINPLGLLFIGIAVLSGVIVTLVILYA